MSDKTVVVREVKLTLNFVIAEPFFDPKVDYNGKVDEWIRKHILEFLNGQYPSTELAPITAYMKSEDVTSKS